MTLEDFPIWTSKYSFDDFQVSLVLKLVSGAHTGPVIHITDEISQVKEHRFSIHFRLGRGSKDVLDVCDNCIGLPAGLFISCWGWELPIDSDSVCEILLWGLGYGEILGADIWEWESWEEPILFGMGDIFMGEALLCWEWGDTILCCGWPAPGLFLGDGPEPLFLGDEPMVPMRPLTGGVRKVILDGPKVVGVIFFLPCCWLGTRAISAGYVGSGAIPAGYVRTGAIPAGTVLLLVWLKVWGGMHIWCLAHVQ